MRPIPRTMLHPAANHYQAARKISSETRHTPQSIIKQAVADRLDYEEWLLARVDAGITDADAGRTCSREIMLKNWVSVMAEKRQLEYSRAAGDDLELIKRYIEADNPKAAAHAL